MNCQIAKELIKTDYIDGRLSLQKETELLTHLEQCPSCRKLAEEMQSLRESFCSMEREVPPHFIWENIKTSISYVSRRRVLLDVLFYLRDVFRNVYLRPIVAVFLVLVLVGGLFWRREYLRRQDINLIGAVVAEEQEFIKILSSESLFEDYLGIGDVDDEFFRELLQA